MTKIELTNCGPITSATLIPPSPGGVLVLRGKNGVGKSQALNAVDALTSGGKKATNLSVNDKALTGQVTGCGVTITLGARNRRTGELEVETIEGRLSIADFVDPEIVDPVKADARRLKVLVTLAGTTGDPSLFYGIAGGKDEFEEIVSPDRLTETDLLKQAEGIKRDFDKAAKKIESQAVLKEGKATGLREASEQIDTDVSTDSELLQESLEEAIRAETDVKSRYKAHVDALGRQEKAKADLRKMLDAYDGPDMERVENDLKETIELQAEEVSERTRIYTRIGEMETELAELKNQYSVACSAVMSCDRRIEAQQETIDGIKQHHDLAESVRTKIAEAVPPVVKDSEVVEAEAVVTSSRKAIELGALARQAISQQEEATVALAEAAKLRERSAHFRNSGDGIDQVLTDVVSKATDLVRVEHGRIVQDTERGTTLYHERSHGQRWRTAIDIALPQLGETGMMTIPQTAWEGLDEENRAGVARHAEKRGISVITAESSEGSELTSSVYGE